MENEQTENSVASHGSTLRDFLGILHTEMDIAWSRESISREQVHRWGCMIREALDSSDDNQVITPEWLETQGFQKRTGPGFKSTHIRKDVNGTLSICSQFGNVWWNQEHLRFCRTRGEVRRLISAMGLDA